MANYLFLLFRELRKNDTKIAYDVLLTPKDNMTFLLSDIISEYIKTHKHDIAMFFWNILKWIFFIPNAIVQLFCVMVGWVFCVLSATYHLIANAFMHICYERFAMLYSFFPTLDIFMQSLLIVWVISTFWKIPNWVFIIYVLSVAFSIQYAVL